MEYGNLIVDKIGSKLIFFGLNKTTLVTKLQTGVATQLKSSYTFNDCNALYAHQTYLAM
jgi:hypothetical protein